MNHLHEIQKRKRRNRIVIVSMIAAVWVLAGVCLFIGSSNMTLQEGLLAIAKKGTPAHNRIIWNIRFPRVMAAVIAGAGLSVAGLIMQTTLNNSMASPSKRVIWCSFPALLNFMEKRAIFWKKLLNRILIILMPKSV